MLSFSGACRNCNQTKLYEEAQLYDDIVVFDFLDTYVNLTIKTILSLNWVFNVYNTDIFLKLDDDALLNVTDVYQTVLKHFHYQTKYASNYIAGCCNIGLPVIRNLQHKWGESREAYSPPIYPRYCIGLSYALTRSTIPLLLNQTLNTPLIHLEDVSVGLLAQKAGKIKLINIPYWMGTWNVMDDSPKHYNRYHVIHTGQGRIDKVEDLWKNIYDYSRNEYQRHKY